MQLASPLRRFLPLDTLVVGVIALILWWLEKWSIFALGLFGFLALFITNLVFVRLTKGRTDYYGFATGGLMASIFAVVCFSSGFIQAIVAINHNSGDGIGEGLAMLFGLTGALFTGLIGYIFWRVSQD